jgi:hypothetical protein
VDGLLTDEEFPIGPGESKKTNMAQSLEILEAMTKALGDFVTKYSTKEEQEKKEIMGDPLGILKREAYSAGKKCCDALSFELNNAEACLLPGDHEKINKTLGESYRTLKALIVEGINRPAIELIKKQGMTRMCVGWGVRDDVLMKNGASSCPVFVGAVGGVGSWSPGQFAEDKRSLLCDLNGPLPEYCGEISGRFEIIIVGSDTLKYANPATQWSSNFDLFLKKNGVIVLPLQFEGKKETDFTEDLLNTKKYDLKIYVGKEVKIKKETEFANALKEIEEEGSPEALKGIKTELIEDLEGIEKVKAVLVAASATAGELKRTMNPELLGKLINLEKERIAYGNRHGMSIYNPINRQSILYEKEFLEKFKAVSIITVEEKSPFEAGMNDAKILLPAEVTAFNSSREIRSCDKVWLFATKK